MSNQQTLPALFSKFLDTFFHLPTLFTFLLISVLILWKVSDAGLHIGVGYIRLHTNQRNITLDWLDGCCDLDW